MDDVKQLEHSPTERQKETAVISKASDNSDEEPLTISCNKTEYHYRLRRR